MQLQVKVVNMSRGDLVAVVWSSAIGVFVLFS
jgi:hypothetical protein